MRTTVLVLASCLFCRSISAQQADSSTPPQPEVPHDVRWEAVQKVHPGELVELRDSTSGKHSECLLKYVDDAVLACQPDDVSQPEESISYPRTAIDRVWVFHQVHESNQKWTRIAAGVGALIGGAVLSGGGSRGVVLGVCLGAAAGTGFVTSQNRDQIVTKRKLVYARR